MTDHSMMKLGRRPRVVDHRVPALAKYLRTVSLPSPPAAQSWLPDLSKFPGVAWGMMGNDTVGDCTCAEVGHTMMGWSAYTRPTPKVLSTAEVLALYSAITGYNPANPASDQGAYMPDVLNYWLSHRIADPHFTDGLDGYAVLNVADVAEVQDAITWFGNISMGIQLPLSAQSQDVWDVTGDPQDPNGPAYPGSWGGHAVPGMAYDAAATSGSLSFITWGAPKRMTWAFFKTYVDEAYARLNTDWINATKMSPAGVDWSGLIADNAVLKAAT